MTEQAERWLKLEEEKKSIEAELEHQTSEEVQDSECEKETVEQESKEEPTERRGLFGARKRERNDKTVLGLYTVAAVYLMYTAFVTGQAIYDGNVASGKDMILKIFFVILFGGTAVWLLYVCWKLKKRIKQTEEEEAAREAAESGEPMPEKLSTTEKIKNVFASTPTQTSSVASRAKVYQNPVEEEYETDGEDAEDKNEDADQSENEASESESAKEE